MRPGVEHARPWDPPIVHEVAQRLKGKIRVLKIDVDKNPALAQKQGIRGVPTFLPSKAGKIVRRQPGTVPAGVLIDRIRAHG